MFPPDEPKKLALAELRARCDEETSRYFRHLVDDARYCFELFRRAVVEHDEGAWEAIVEQYRELIGRWVRTQAVFEKLSEDETYFVNRAFEKFWARQFSATDFGKFPDLRSILKYIKTCAVTGVIDYHRTHGRNQADSLDQHPHFERQESEFRPDEEVLEKLRGEELWTFIRPRLQDDLEYCVFQDSFLFGLKPSEIFERWPAMFHHVSEVYRVKERVITRLRHDSELLAYFSGRVEKI